MSVISDHINGPRSRGIFIQLFGDLSSYFEECLEQLEVVKTCVGEDQSLLEKNTRWECDLWKTYDQVKGNIKVYLKAGKHALAT